MTVSLTTKGKAKTAAPKKRAAKSKPAGKQRYGDAWSSAGSFDSHTFTALPVIQPKLKVGDPNDKYEQEADRVADEVMRMPDSEVVGATGAEPPMGNGTPAVQRMCADCPEEEETLQRKPDQATYQPLKIASLSNSYSYSPQFFGSSSEARLQKKEMEEEEEPLQTKRGNSATSSIKPGLEADIQSLKLKSGGQPLNQSDRSFFETRFGCDFSQVRIHTSPQAATAAQLLQARAFTVGSNVVFATGQYAPNTLEGKRLLAHELTHVVQQRGGQPQPTKSRRAATYNITNPPSKAESSHSTEITEINSVTSNDPAGRSHRSTSVQNAQISSKFSSNSFPPVSTRATSTTSQVISRQTETEAETEEDVNPADELSLLELGLLKLVRMASPTLAELIEKGPEDLLEQLLNEGFSILFEELFDDLNVQELVTEVTTSMAGMAEAIEQGDKDTCAYMGSRLEGTKAFIDEFFASETFENIESEINKWAEQAEEIRSLFLEPVFEEVIELYGKYFALLKDIFAALTSAGASVRSFSESAWEWVCDYFGIDQNDEGGLVDWLMMKANEIWGQISAELEPIKEPLMVLGSILAMGSPFATIQLVRETLMPLADTIQWLLEHQDDPDLIANAHAELGDTYLPQLLEGLAALKSQLSDSLGETLEPLEQLLATLSSLTSGLTDFASSLGEFLQSIYDAVMAFVAWVQGTWEDIKNAINTLTTEAWEAIRPVLAVLSSLTMAILIFPGGTILAVAGWGWTMLCQSLRVQILQVYLHLVQTALASIQLPDVFGMLQNGIAAFFESLEERLEEDETGVMAAMDNMAMIIAGANPEFVLGFLGGLMVGTVEGILDPLLLVWDIFSVLVQIQMWSLSMVTTQLGDALDTAKQIGEDILTDITTDIAEEAKANFTPELLDRFAELAITLEPLVNALQEKFMPALEAMMTGEALTYEQALEWLGTLWTAIEEGIASYAKSIANGIIDLLQDPLGISWDTGYTTGWFTGTILVEVVATFCSFGTLEAVLGTSKAARLVIDAIKLADSIVGEAFALLGKFADEVIGMVSNLMTKLGDFAMSALDEVFKLAMKAFDELKRFVDDIIALVFKGGGKALDDVAEEAAERAAKEAAERAAKEAGEDIAEEGLKKGDDLVDDMPDGKTKDSDTDSDREQDEDLDDSDRDRDKDHDEEDDTDEKRAARQAANDAWLDLSNYASRDLRSKTEMQTRLAAQDTRVLGARISYDLEESSETWSVEATATGDLGDTAKRNTGSGWIARDGSSKHYGSGSEDIEGAKKAFIAEMKRLSNNKKQGATTKEIEKISNRLKIDYHLKEIIFKITDSVNGKSRLIIGSTKPSQIELSTLLNIHTKKRDDSKTRDNINQQTVYEIVYSSLHNETGEPLSTYLRTLIRLFLNIDLAKVRVHKSSPWPRLFGAKAFTYRNHIYFDFGEYKENHLDGIHLLVHELVHTAQQHDDNLKTNPQNKIFQVNTTYVSNSTEPEREADRIANNTIAILQNEKKSGIKSEIPKARIVQQLQFYQLMNIAYGTREAEPACETRIRTWVEDGFGNAFNDRNIGYLIPIDNNRVYQTSTPPLTSGWHTESYIVDMHADIMNPPLPYEEFVALMMQGPIWNDLVLRDVFRIRFGMGLDMLDRPRWCTQVRTRRPYAWKQSLYTELRPCPLHGGVAGGANSPDNYCHFLLSAVMADNKSVYYSFETTQQRADFWQGIRNRIVNNEHWYMLDEMTREERVHILYNWVVYGVRGVPAT